MVYAVLVMLALSIGDSAPRPEPPTPPREEAAPVGLSPSAFLYRNNPKVRHAVALEQILPTSRETVQVDGVPPIYKPTVVAANVVQHLGDDDPVIGVVVENSARAYPIKILERHLVINDMIGSTPLAVNYQPLCGGGIIFDRVVDGTTRSFGNSGFVYQNDLLLWDHESETFWSSFAGQAIVGPLTGMALTVRVSTQTTWKQWRDKHPQTDVLIGPDPAMGYNQSPYDDYKSTDRLLFPVLHNDRRFHRKMIVTGILLNGTAKAYPHGLLKRLSSPQTDTVGGHTVTIRYDSESDACRLFDADGSELPVQRAYWFAWYTFHPESELFQAALSEEK